MIRRRGAIFAVLLVTTLTPRMPAQKRPLSRDGASGRLDTTSAAYKQFERFLSLAVVTREQRPGMMDSVYFPRVDDERDDMRWVAAYRILTVSTEGDSGRATAVLTSVARQRDTDNGWTARYGIREDTAHWRLVRSVETGNRWKVAGEAIEGFGIFQVGQTVRWLKGSRARALTAADSIRRARRLEALR